MVINLELESKFKAFSQDYQGTKKTLNKLNEKVNSIEAKLRDFFLKSNFGRPSAIVLGKISIGITIDQDPKSVKSGLGSVLMFPSSLWTEN